MHEWVEAGAQVVIALGMGAHTWMRCRDYMRSEEERKDRLAQEAINMLAQSRVADEMAKYAQAPNRIPTQNFPPGNVTFTPSTTTTWSGGMIGGGGQSIVP